MKILRSLLPVAVVPLLLLSVESARAGDGGELMCPAPLMVCRNTAGTPDGCPPGYDCACVPSCPNCRDCVARVCIAAAKPQCRTACDCEPGLGCFDEKCIAGFAPVFCCDSDQCPAGQQCQHRDGRQDQCRQDCIDTAWRCSTDDASTCGDGRVCTCSAACPFCENCGPNVCVPPNLGITPYNCNDDGSCDRAGDRCICVSSCAACDDCALNLCVPACNSDDGRCGERLHKVQKAIRMVTARSQRCFRDTDCTHVGTSTECLGTCGVFVNQRRRSFVARAVRYLDHKVCSTYRDDGCPYATPRCLHAVPACVEGQCVGVPPDTTEGSASSR